MANFFKIINITASLPRRHAKKNSTLQIKYGDGFKTVTKDLGAGEELFIICDRLPMNIQKLNLEKLIVVNRVTQNEMKRTQRKRVTPKPVDQVYVEPKVTLIEEKIEEKPKRQYRTKKNTTEEVEKIVE